MDLLNSLYTIADFQSEPEGFSAVLELHPEHIIYKGHFPGHPVTPGVIQLQIINDLLDYYTQRKWKLASMPHCKYLIIINPENTRFVQLRISCSPTENGLKVNVNGFVGTSPFIKINGAFYREF